ncbi:dynein axonemal assembly factor 1 homolog [Amyelois transitella]|uniref:dynein axonemal assembly factor 1 homolog n=1 Tax=Amyelois transitella TaxID=680683 RepID=UPI00298FEF3B|nr:dynein axonemal assembly factor 1 homolog [Amyelois transitella]
MNIPGTSVVDPEYIEKKRAELEIFFKDAKLPKDVLQRVIENELKPLTEPNENPNPSYIAASFPGEVKSEYEVMTGQPFTEVKESNKPFTDEEIREMINANPILIDKARQIQIASKQMKPIAVPLDHINLPSYTQIRSDIDSAKGNKEQVDKINYQNMQALMNSVADFKTINQGPPKLENDSESEETDYEEEYEAIEKVVSQYTDKSYETRFQETKEMLQKLADDYESPECTTNTSDTKANIMKNPILKESSIHVIKGQIRKTAIQEVQEKYAINESIRDNPINLNLSGEIEIKTEQKKKEEEPVDIEEVFPKSFEARLKDTQKALQDINVILDDTSLENSSNKSLPEEPANNFEESQNESDVNEQVITGQQKFDERMEQTLQNALEDIFELGDHDNRDNKALEFTEMKSLARNIVEGAENLSTLIREDITNKLNSMNELLNDVNEALENSKKSNIAYQNIKEEGEILRRKHGMIAESAKLEEMNEDARETAEENTTENIEIESNVSRSQIDDINDSIKRLNVELKCHEDRINQSKERYEMRNKECKTFMKEVDDILQKSHDILHPIKGNINSDVPNLCDDEKTKIPPPPPEIPLDPVIAEKSAKMRKELWDIDLSNVSEERNKRLEEFKKQEQERNKRIDGLLCDIKHNMKDNKEVLRLANNLLRREESRKKPLQQSCKIRELPAVESDAKGQGDNAGIVDANNSLNELKQSIECGLPPTEGETKRVRITSVERQKQIEERKAEEAEQEREKKREIQKKFEEEMEEMNRGPRMTKEFIRNHCKQHKLYCTPYLNDILYLHFKGFSKIENLEEYTGLKCIFLENNGIQRIEGLDAQSELKCLYLHYNVVRKIENLAGCPKLDTLNLDHNFVCKIENLDVVPDLHTLSIAHNMLSSYDDLEQLRNCRNLSVLDLSYNRLEDPLIVDVLADMIILKVLVLTGNPVVRIIPAYRKTLTLRIKDLQNLDNRPVFPRDRACAEAWQRGGVQEEIAERKRWIAREQEKVMQSVRYLIRMRDEKRAIRDAKEKEEREKLGLPEGEEQKENAENKPKPVTTEVDETEGPSILEQKFGPSEVKVKDGVAVDMLTGSEADDSTSEESSDVDSEDFKVEDKEDGTTTNMIEWSNIEQGKCLVQEVSHNPMPPQDDYWGGYREVQSPSTSRGDDFMSNFSALGNLMFSQQPHIERKKASQILAEHGMGKKSKAKITEVISEEKTVPEDAKKKALIEIIEPVEQVNPVNEKPTVGEAKFVSGIVEEGNLIIDHDKKIISEKELKPSLKKKSSASKIKKPLKKVVINEIRHDEDKPSNEEPFDGDGKSEKSKEENKKDENIEKKDNENQSRNSSGDIDQRRDSVQHSSGDGVALINYMHNMNADNIDDDEDMKPSAEDLEIFAELDREQEERQARIDRGEPAVDPMKLYDKETMDAFYKAQECVPAHEVTEKVSYTTYKNDNAFDRIALSQLTGGEKPDESKVKLTRVPGAILYQYVEKQVPETNVEYEIGEEVVESAPSSGETESINISSDSSSSEPEIDVQIKNINRTSFRPSTANKSKVESENGENVGKTNKTDESVEVTNLPSSSKHESDQATDKEAKRSIINTINSYEDGRYPSQGINYSDMTKNARIDQSVASEILTRTQQYEEREMFRQIDVLNSHAGKIDNKTNAIIEHISGQLENEYTLPEVSRILEVHMEVAEQRWRAGEFVNYVPVSPPESAVDDNDNEDTLVPSHDTSLEDTLTEDKVNAMVKINEDNESDHGTEAKDDSKETTDVVKSDIDTQQNDDDCKGESNDLKNAELNDSKVEFESFVDESETIDGDDVFEDCVGDGERDNFDRIDETYSIEMKLALGLGDENNTF